MNQRTRQKKVVQQGKGLGKRDDSVSFSHSHNSSAAAKVAVSGSEENERRKAVQDEERMKKLNTYMKKVRAKVHEERMVEADTKRKAEREKQNEEAARNRDIRMTMAKAAIRNGRTADFESADEFFYDYLPTMKQKKEYNQKKRIRNVINKLSAK